MIYQRNTDGGVINPPIIQSYERDLHDANQRCDFAGILRLTAKYNAERNELVMADEGTDTGLGWTADDMRGGVGENATAFDIRPRFPEGQQYMPAGVDEAQLARDEQMRGEMREMRAMLAQLVAQGAAVPAGAMDTPTPAVDAAKPTGGTTISAGPSDKPTPYVEPSAPTGHTGISAGPVDAPNPAPPVNLIPGGGVVPAPDAPDATGNPS